jgi:hypothetical protein
MELAGHKPFRWSLEPISGGVRIVIPREWSWPKFLFIPVWIGFWGFGLGEVARSFWLKPVSQWDVVGFIFMSIWTAGWICGGIAVFFVWLWNFGGCETIEIDSTLLNRSRKIFGVGISKSYELSRITNVRFLPAERKGKSRIPAGIGFEYSTKTKRVAQGLGEVEIRELIEKIKQQYPQLSH